MVNQRTNVTMHTNVHWMQYQTQQHQVQTLNVMDITVVHKQQQLYQQQVHISTVMVVIHVLKQDQLNILVLLTAEIFCVTDLFHVHMLMMYTMNMVIFCVMVNYHVQNQLSQ